ncbi:MAG: Zinc/iron permease [Candidatus Roizmanbacteria bacterium GW2011_GWA2_35_19]|uniref:Zinc/iron permease n=2 Tax=Candidatus Roizmaniibacteriota TaxID=1752723 RepID=A0A0G0BWR8_9BACT|nr:MAG: Zinc/iron permease [Candidatus Roizmanbacteria bacterium GW2011_GWC2_35_12]KKP73774.1 MAG: Zinc/iron permease [Candidatus Roizmanbacteria bacterium GW2011_GWA2_35_19]
MSILNSIIIANIIISLISLIGGIVVIQKTLLTKKIIPYMVAFAAGVILTTVFLDLLPEALELSEGTKVNIFTPVFIGILFSFFLERFVLWFHHHESTHGIKPSLFLIIIGDGIHNFIDGVVIASAFGTSLTLGIITTFAIAAHEVPQEIADLGILIHSGLSKTWALILNLFSALTAIAGGIIAFYFLNSLKNSLPILLSFSSGIFIYIAGSDLIPGLHKEYRKQKKWAQVLPFIAGIILMYFMTILLHE